VVAGVAAAAAAGIGTEKPATPRKPGPEPDRRARLRGSAAVARRGLGVLASGRWAAVCSADVKILGRAPEPSLSAGVAA